MGKIELTPKCKRCGHRLAISPNDRLPAMVGFELEDGTVINLCRDCLMDLGKAKQQGRADEFFKEMGL